jgi:hypothetical protein
VTIAQADYEAGVGQDFADDTLQFDHVVFSHEMPAAEGR